jgi:hypothetical protein
MKHLLSLIGTTSLASLACAFAGMSVLLLVAATSGVLLPWVAAGTTSLLWICAAVATALGLSGGLLSKQVAAMTTARGQQGTRSFAWIGLTAAAVALAIAITGSILAAIADRNRPQPCVSWRDAAASAALAASASRDTLSDCPQN